jgi:putative membrane protein
MNASAASNVRSIHIWLLATFMVVLTWSAIAPFDYFIWLLEIFPALIGVGLLIATFPRFQFTTFAYTTILLFCTILAVGAHYTYGDMPLFEWLQQQFDLSRNYYDRFAHTAQGFFPAIVAREVLIRLSPLESGKWLFFVVTSICLAISALYEMIEWWIAVTTGSAADLFLATQGDVWDTQWDMFLALLGAMAAQLIFASYHNRKIAALHDGVKGRTL